MKFIYILPLLFICLKTAPSNAQSNVTDLPLKELHSLTEAGSYDKYPSLAVDQQNNSWLSYTSMKADKESIVVRHKTGLQWGPELQIDEGQGTESNSRLLISKTGQLWVFWQGKRNGKWAVYAKTNTKSKWGPELKLSPDNENNLHPAVIEDSSGNIWLSYERVKPGQIDLRFRVFQQNQWSRPENLGQGGMNRRASLAASPSGQVWVAWDSPASGNYDIWLARLSKKGRQPARIDTLIQATKSLSIDDSPSIACAADGTLWLAWNSLRSLQKEKSRSDQHSGAIFLKAFKSGQWFVTGKISEELQFGEISYRNIDKTPNDEEEDYWHWKQTQTFPILYIDGQQKLWITWRTDRYGAHNFDLWARVYNGNSWSELLELTTFSPGRDEWPSFAALKGKGTYMAWEGQTLPEKGKEKELMGGFVDAYNTNANHNVVLYARLPEPIWKNHPHPLQLMDIESTDKAIDLEQPLIKAPALSISADPKLQVFFGDPHSHTVLSDGKYGWPDQLIYLAKEKTGLDFGVVSDHSEMGRLQNSEYQELALLSKNLSVKDHYIDFLGFEWTAPPAYGHRIVIYPDTKGLNISSAEQNGNSTEKLYAFIKAYGGIVSAHHTGQAVWGRWNPAAFYQSQLEPNFEVVSFHGRFEYYKNPFEGRRQVPGHQYQDALKQGRRSGIMGASDTHFLTPGEGGLTAVLSPSLSRQELFQAIKNRHTYATSGVKIGVDFSVNGQIMGSEFKVSGTDSVRIHFAVQGTAPIDRIEVVKNTEDHFALLRLEQVPGTSKGIFMLYDPSKPQGGKRISSADLSRVSIDLVDKTALREETSYYLRVTQTDGQQAWTSPVWLIPGK
ncbi:CehA/McbA family metallohydrolase [Pedobacter nutrimenti]|uniref:Uncharacterized protein DUF3604 n=1 Tax=Pedobacter nutrimenti TaxID=1241337 RepID=A0A318UAZ2_9SPHI|nr:CehA/McbA family metallohydrolase [Pedobacter nutrimenti]PYF72693.1 uncharacterized protein DUF3604 [Pedobacter nutrimenti]